MFEFVQKPSSAEQPTPLCCPKCHSQHLEALSTGRHIGGAIGTVACAAGGIATALTAARAGATVGLIAGPVGAIAGGIAGLITAGILGGSVGGIAGSVVGDAFDDAMIDQLHCLHCGHTFIQP